MTDPDSGDESKVVAGAVACKIPPFWRRRPDQGGSLPTFGCLLCDSLERCYRSLRIPPHSSLPISFHSFRDAILI
ncbi:Hypothetical protein NTJ_16334 [Nesidiocoris tenuis]|nr:Hypothetical protein NTJ_16334 [Nesidiocoris tenuis]